VEVNRPQLYAANDVRLHKHPSHMYTHTHTNTQAIFTHLLTPHLFRSYTRQCMVNRGLLPFLATPAAGETLLEDAVRHAAHLRLVKAHDHVVVVSVHTDARACAFVFVCVCVCLPVMGLSKMQGRRPCWPLCPALTDLTSMAMQRAGTLDASLGM
jgi:hypothetical protein